MAYLERKIDRFLDEWKKNPARKPLVVSVHEDVPALLRRTARVPDAGEGQSESDDMVPRAVRLQEGAGAALARARHLRRAQL